MAQAGEGGARSRFRGCASRCHEWRLGAGRRAVQEGNRRGMPASRRATSARPATSRRQGRAPVGSTVTGVASKVTDTEKTPDAEGVYTDPNFTTLRTLV